MKKDSSTLHDVHDVPWRWCGVVVGQVQMHDAVVPPQQDAFDVVGPQDNVRIRVVPYLIILEHPSYVAQQRFAARHPFGRVNGVVPRPHSFQHVFQPHRDFQCLRHKTWIHPFPTVHGLGEGVKKKKKKKERNKKNDKQNQTTKNKIKQHKQTTKTNNKNKQTQTTKTTKKNKNNKKC